jgi:hypothetical protein
LNLWEDLKKSQQNDLKFPIQVWQAFLSVLNSLLEKNQGDEIYLFSYHMLKYFFKLCMTNNLVGSELLSSADYISHTCQLILKHCTYHQKEMRAHAVSAFYLIGKANFLVSKSYASFQEAITYSLSDLVERLKGSGASYLEQSLAAILLLKKMDQDNLSVMNDAQFEEVVKKATNIYNDTLQITQQENLGNSADPAVLEDLLFNMASSYSHLPEVREKWVARLADHHSKEYNYAEAAACFVEISDLITQINKKTSSNLDDALENTTKIFKFYKQATVSYDLAALYELSHEICTTKLIPRLLSRKAYKEMEDCYKILTSVMDKLVKAEEARYRMLGTYYRVGFYGLKFGKLDGKQYIYKRPKITQLAEVVTYIKEKYAQQLGVPIKIIADSGRVSEKNLDPNDCNVQITFVQPYFDEKESALRKTFIEKNSGISRFTFSTPFTKDGKSHSTDIAKQCMMVSILDVPKPFPFLKTRQEVVNVAEIILSPLASATENISRRIDQFENVLSEEEPQKQKQMLTSLLQGSIMPRKIIISLYF